MNKAGSSTALGRSSIVYAAAAQQQQCLPVHMPPSMCILHVHRATRARNNNMRARELVSRWVSVSGVFLLPSSLFRIVVIDSSLHIGLSGN